MVEINLCPIHSSLIHLHYVLFIQVLMFLTVFKTISFVSIIVLCSLISHGNFERKAMQAMISEL